VRRTVRIENTKFRMTGKKIDHSFSEKKQARLKDSITRLIERLKESPHLSKAKDLCMMIFITTILTKCPTKSQNLTTWSHSKKSSKRK
jgi:hypothetical protein